MKKLKIFIIDESPFFRRWFRKIILALPGGHIIGEAKDPLGAIEMMRLMRPDVVILDVKTRWNFGIDLDVHIRRINPVPKLIFLTNEIGRRCQIKVCRETDLILDKITEYNRIPEILMTLCSNPGR